MSPRALTLTGLVALLAACGPAAPDCLLADGGACPPPIVADAGVWTWVDVPGTACGNGAPTGFGLNPGTAQGDLVVYLQGGGACWDALTCFTLKSAVHLSDGFSAATFAADTQHTASFFDRTLGGNPFASTSMAFVPYCTGDVHAGDAVQSYSGAPQAVHHHGAANLQLVLDRLKGTFPHATRILLMGSSAGAFGAQLNYPRVIATFPAAEVHVLADSGQMVNPAGGLLGDWLAAWNVTIPADCAGCRTDFTRYPAWLADAHPHSRFGLLAYTQDGVLQFFFATFTGDFETATRGLLASAYDGRPNARYFLLAGTSHTMLGSVSTLSAPGGPTLLTWFDQWLTGDAAWANVKP